jgi:hypothetical protein
MGLPGPSTKDLEDLEKRFSDDILKIELSGPDHHHLSVVDVPGLFHSEQEFWIRWTILTGKTPPSTKPRKTEQLFENSSSITLQTSVPLSC